MKVTPISLGKQIAPQSSLSLLLPEGSPVRYFRNTRFKALRTRRKTPGLSTTDEKWKKSSDGGTVVGMRP